MRIQARTSTSTALNCTKPLLLLTTFGVSILSLMTNESKCKLLSSCDSDTVSEEAIHYEINAPLDELQFKEYIENIRTSHPNLPVFVLFMGK